jgi:hypothetical protein
MKGEWGSIQKTLTKAKAELDSRLGESKKLTTEMRQLGENFIELFLYLVHHLNAPDKRQLRLELAETAEKVCKRLYDEPGEGKQKDKKWLVAKLLIAIDAHAWILIERKKPEDKMEKRRADETVAEELIKHCIGEANNDPDLRYLANYARVAGARLILHRSEDRTKGAREAWQELANHELDEETNGYEELSRYSIYNDRLRFVRGEILQVLAGKADTQEEKDDKDESQKEFEKIVTKSEAYKGQGISAIYHYILSLIDQYNISQKNTVSRLEPQEEYKLLSDAVEFTDLLDGHGDMETNDIIKAGLKKLFPEIAKPPSVAQANPKTFGLEPDVVGYYTTSDSDKWCAMLGRIKLLKICKEIDRAKSQVIKLDKQMDKPRYKGYEDILWRHVRQQLDDLKTELDEKHP